MILNEETIEQINEMESTELVHAAIKAGLFGMQTEFGFTFAQEASVDANEDEIAEELKNELDNREIDICLTESEAKERVKEKGKDWTYSLEREGKITVYPIWQVV